MHTLVKPYMTQKYRIYDETDKNILATGILTLEHAEAIVERISIDIPGNTIVVELYTSKDSPKKK